MKQDILIGLDRATWYYKIGEICEKCKELGDLGLTGIELRPEHPELFSTFPKINNNLLSIINSYDLTLSMHAPLKDLNIASYNPEIREKSLDIYSKTIEYAGNFDNMKYILFHGGKNSFKSNSRFERKERNKALRRTIESFKILLNKCKKYRIKMGIENMTASDWRMTSKISYLREIFNEPELEDLKFVYDYEHAINLSERYSLRILKRFKDRVIAVHIGDDYPKFKDYLTDNKPTLVIEPHHFYREDIIFKKIKDLLTNLQDIL
ncbi:MAG: TIM barrel protein [Candidatus Lokiarchaeota archaeon]|nr:TIM barrel protein [Candidatus Lokiarchaeota archaeon]